MLSPLLYTLFTHDCMARHDSNPIKLCQNNNLSLHETKPKEMIGDYRRRRTEHTSILIDGAVVEQVESFKFLGVHITNELSRFPRQL